MKKKTSVAFLALMGLLLFGCGKKSVTTKKNTQTKVTPDTTVTTKKPTTTKKVEKFTVSVVKNIQDAGTITGTGEIEKGKSTTLEATENTGYLFLGFYDSNDTQLTNQKTYTVSDVSKNVTITAKWTALSNTLTIKKFNNCDPTTPVEFDDDTYGTVEFVSEVKEEYATGEEITLKATPKTGYQFNGWYRVTSEGDRPISETDYLNEEITFKMYGAASTIKAVFGTKKCTIDVITNIEEAMSKYEIYYETAGQYGTATNEAVVFDYDGYYEIDAYANAGYEFLGFYGYNEETEEYDILLDTELIGQAKETVTYMAKFRPYSYELYLNVTPEGVDAGTINVTYNGELYENTAEESITYNTTVTLTAVEGEGYTFVRWYNWVTGETIAETATFDYLYDIADNLYFGAEFAPNKVKINFVVPESMDGMGTVTESGYFDYDSTVEFTATPTKGYVFLGWYVTYTDEETGETEDIKVSADGEKTMTYEVVTQDEMTFIAKFELGEYNGCGHINIDGLDSQYYSDLCSYTDKSFEYGSEVTFVANTEIPGYTFKGWYFGCLTDTEFEDIDSSLLLSTYATYTFTWLYAEEDLGNGDDPNYVCFTAVYDRNLYKVEYSYSDGVNIANDQTWVKFGLKTQLELPTYTGYAFQYWYYNSDVPGEGQVILTNANAMMLQPYSVTGNLTLRAKWLDGIVIASFETDGGTPMKDVEVQYNHPITKPIDPEKDGYTFAGWYNADGQEWVFNQPIVENTTLYAHWTINQYTIALDSQDDSIVTVNNGEIDGTYDFNTKLQLSANVPDGYTFAGWYDDDKLVLEDAEGEYTLESHDVVLVAKFTINEYNVTVRYLRASNREFIILNGINTKFSANGEYINGTTATYDYKTSISVQSTLLSQYVQYVNYYSLNGTRITSYTWSGSTFTVTYNFELPAEDVIIEITVAHTGYQFGVNKNITEGDVPYYTWQYNSSHYTSAGSWSNNSIMYLYAPNVTGYQFEGWYNGTTLVTTKQNGYAYTHAAANETLTAKYSPLYYNVFAETVVDSHTGSDDVDDLIDDEEQYTKSYTVTTSEITGYSFLGWYDVDSSEYVSTDLSYTFTMPHNDVYLQAIYEINSYGMNIQHDIANTKWNELMPGNSGHGDVKVTNESHDYNTEIEFEITTNPGWKFKGIYGVEGDYTFVEADKNRLSAFEALLTDATATTFTFTVPATDYSFFVLWEAKAYNVAYITNGGTLDSSMQTGILFGIEAQLKIPVWEGGQKDFVGWLYQDIDEAIEYRFTEYDGLAACYNIPKNIQLQAIWGQHLQDITFEVGTNVADFATDTKTFIQKVPNGGYVNRPEDPVKKGHTFLGWYTTADGDVQWDFANLPVTEDKTIYAHWEVNSFEVVLRNFSGQYKGYITYYVNDDIQGTVTSNTTFTIPFGSTLELHAHMYIGYNISRWEYTVSGMSGWQSLSTSADYNYTLVQDVKTNIDLMYAKYNNMACYEYNSSDTTCVITQVSSSYRNRTSYSVPEFVTGIADGAFANCPNITELTLPWTGLNSGADSRTGNKLFGIIFGSNSQSTDIYNAVQQYYYNGTNAVLATTRYIPKSLTKVVIYAENNIAPYSFYGISSLVTFEGELTRNVYGHAFELCTSLKNVLFDDEDNFRYIAEQAFYGCTALEEIYIPSSCTDIDDGVFANCYSLRSITAPFIGAAYFGTDYFDMEEFKLIGWWFIGTDEWTQAVGEDEDLTYIVAQQYDDNTSHTLEVNVPLSFTEFHFNYDKDDYYYVPGYGFYGFSSLEEVTLPDCADGMTIHTAAFYGCSNLNVINNIDNVDYIDYQAFAYALNGEITFGVDSILDEIHSEAFIYSGLTKLTIYAYNLDTIFEKAFAYTDKLTEVYFYEPENWQYIELYNEAFANSGVSEITFGKRVLNINNDVFSGCTKLKEVEFTTVSYIGDNAFYGCKELTKVTINEFIDSCSLGDRVFSMCTSLSKVTMDKSLESVGQYIFNHCAKLNTINMPFVGKDRNCSLTTYDVNYTWPYWFGLANTAVDGGYNMAINGVRSFAPAGTINIYLDDIINIPAYMFYRNESGTQNKASYIYWHITGCQNGTYSVGDYAFAANNSSNNGIVYTTGEELNNGNAQLVGIGKYAFRGNGITNISALISNAITIGEHAFDASRQSGGTTELVITNATTSIGDCAFACNWLTSITLGKNAVLGKFVFEDFKDSVIYITYTGTGIEYNAIKGSWARTADEEWYAGSNISSVVTSDGNTYAVTA